MTRLQVKRDSAKKKLTNILVRQLVRNSDSLRLMLDRLAVHDGRLELLEDATVDRIALQRHTPCQYHFSDRPATQYYMLFPFFLPSRPEVSTGANRLRMKQDDYP